MAGPSIRIGNSDNSSLQTGSKTGLGCLILFTLPFFGGGLMAIVTGIKGVMDGEEKAAIAIMVGTIFIGVASAILIAAIKGMGAVKEAAAKQAENPDQPWLWKPDWAAGEIPSETGASLKIAGFFAIFWNAISWTVAVAAMSDYFKSGDKKILFVLLFPAIGLFLIAWFVYALLQHRKYGVSKFRMLSVPGVLGGTIRGAVEVPVQVNPPEGFKVRLACVRRVTSGSGKNRSTRESVQWEDEKIIKKDILEHDRTRTGIPVFFNLPFEQPASEDGNPAIIWRLTVEAEVPGIDFAAKFTVPVFKTPESREDAVEQADPTASYQPNQGEYQWPADSPIHLAEHGDSLEVDFPAGRNKGVIFGLAIFCAVWTGAIWFMIEQKAPLMFVIVFGFFDALMLIFLFSAMFSASRIEAGSMGLKIHSRFLVPTGTKILQPDEISRIQLHNGMSSGEKVWYDIRAIGKNGRRYTLGGGIAGKRPAAWLAERIAEHLGVEFHR